MVVCRRGLSQVSATLLPDLGQVANLRPIAQSASPVFLRRQQLLLESVPGRPLGPALVPLFAGRPLESRCAMPELPNNPPQLLRPNALRHHI